METLTDILETTQLQRVSSGHVFTEGPLWHPDDFWYFVDIRVNHLYRITLGQKPTLVRETSGGNGTTFDLHGNLINCEGDARRLTRATPDGAVTTLVDRFEGKRFNRPNDVICAADGSLLFTDPGIRVPVEDRDIGEGAIYRLTPAGTLHRVCWCEYPNGLALSPDGRTLYAANTRWTQYLHAIELNDAGEMVRRRVFADMSHDQGGVNGVPDGMKVDAAGRVFCTGTTGVWVFAPDGQRIGIIETPEICANVAFGGPDLRTLMLTASTSIYTLRTRTPGLPHPWYVRRG